MPALMKRPVRSGRKVSLCICNPACAVNRNASCRILSRIGRPFELSAAFCIRLGSALQPLSRSLHFCRLSCLLRVSQSVALGPVEVSEAHCARRTCRLASLEPSGCTNDEREGNGRERENGRFRRVSH